MAERPEPLNPTAFLVCAIVGSVGICILKWLDMPQGVVILWPVGIMVGYAIWHYKLHAYLSLVGDNLYYLGLLYTLVSLAASLYEFSPKAEDIKSITPIITNFGIAIFSTIIGVALRVYFGLRQTDPEEIEQSARVELAEVVKELNLGIGDATHSFLQSSKEMQDNLRRGLDDTKNAIDENLKQNLSQLDTAVGSFISTVQKADDRFEENQQKLQGGFEEAQSVIEGAADVLGKSRQKLQEGSDAMAESLNGLFTKIDKISAPEDLLEKILQPLSQQIEEVAGQIGDAGEALANRLDSIEISTDKFEQELQKAIGGFFDTATQNFEQELQNFSSVVQSANENFVTSVQNLSKQIDDIEVSNDLPEKLLKQSVEPFERSTKQIGTAGKNLVKTLNSVQRAAVALEQSLCNTSDALPTGQNWKHKIRNFFQSVKPQKERTETQGQHQDDTETGPDPPVKLKKERTETRDGKS